MHVLRPSLDQGKFYSFGKTPFSFRNYLKGFQGPLITQVVLTKDLRETFLDFCGLRQATVPVDSNYGLETKKRSELIHREKCF